MNRNLLFAAATLLLLCLSGCPEHRLDLVGTWSVTEANVPDIARNWVFTDDGTVTINTDFYPQPIVAVYRVRGHIVVAEALAEAPAAAPPMQVFAELAFSEDEQRFSGTLTLSETLFPPRVFQTRLMAVRGTP